nr:hypothetical protein NZ312_03180 [Clostridioides difficile]
MIKLLKSKGRSVLLYGDLLISLMSECMSQSTSLKSVRDKSKHKPVKEITCVEDAQTQFTYRDSRGDVMNSQEIVKPLKSLKKILSDDIYFSGQIEYLNENYIQLKKLYSYLI